MGNLNVSLFSSGNKYSNSIKKDTQTNPNFYEKGPVNFYTNETKKASKLDTFEMSNDYRNMYT